MNVVQWVGCLVVFVICLGLPDYIFCQAVSSVACTNGDECASLTNSACDGTTTKCKCNPGFVEDLNDRSTCVQDPNNPKDAQQTKSAAVSSVACTNGDECAPITNSACDGTSTKCKCNPGFVENLTDGSTCVLGPTKTRVSSVDCPAGNECSTITHSSCDGSTHKCKCGAGYVENTPDGDACIQDSSGPKNSQQTKKRVSEVVCTNGGTQCSTIANSACDIPSLKCKCAATYVEDSADGSTCVLQVDSKGCSVQGTECSSIGHAECDSTTLKCKCNDGFKIIADKCIAADKNAGVSATLAFIVLALPVVLSLKEASM